MKNFNNTLYQYDFYWTDAKRKECRRVYMEDFGTIPTDTELDLYIGRLDQCEWDSLITDVRYCEQEYGEKTYIVIGKIGTWRGTFDGGKIIKGLRNTIYECIKDSDFITIQYKNNQLCIVAEHHDGVNIFKLRELTEAGEDYAERHEYDYSDKELHQRLFKSSRWSRRVSAFPDYYGW